MYKIGEFSRLTDLSVRTLRYYDELGILKPDYIDTFSGYRYYTEDNVKEADNIKFMKELDFSLEEILLYKGNLTSEVVKEKKMQLERQMYLLELKCQRLELLSNCLEDNHELYDSQVMVLKKVNEEGIRKAS